MGWTDKVILRNDTFAVSRAGTTAAWGIGVVCGTGMNCAGVGPDGRTVRFPALAELSGDFAPGGAWLGLRALGLALRAGDGRGAPTTLRERVPAHFGVADAETALSGLYTGVLPYARLFELARVLLDAAAEGDAPARAAADLLADEVVAFVRAAVVRLDLQQEAVEVVLGGGIFDTTDTAFHARVAAGVNAVAPRATLVRLDAPPVLGAALIGLDAEEASPDALATLRRRSIGTGDAPTAWPGWDANRRRRPDRPTTCGARRVSESELTALRHRRPTRRPARAAWRRPPGARRPPAASGPGP